MFSITGGKGFKITFPNGYTVSVQFGTGNYCANRDYTQGWTADSDRDAGARGCPQAETAVWGSDGKMLPISRGKGGRIRRTGGTDTVQGWQSPHDVLALLKWAERQKVVVTPTPEA